MGTGSVATSGCFQGMAYLQVPEVESLTLADVRKLLSPEWWG
jgi:hypothetical protein